MKKRNLALLTATLALALTACGASDSAKDAAQGSEASKEGGSASGKELRLVNGKIEVDAQLKELAAAYEKESGVKVNIESMGGGIDIQGTLKGYFQADNMPDIFVNGGETDFKNWEGHLVDMSGEKWVSDTEAAFKDADGKVIGFPYTTEAIGLAYNADVLEKAGIDPKSITGPDSMQKAFETLNSKKDELGLTAVVGYVAEATNLYWSTGNHLFGVYEDGGLKRDDTTYFDLLKDGTIDNERFTEYAKMVDLFNKYSDPALLVSGTYDQQIQNFSSGKYAFKEGIDTIQTNSPSWWAVYDNDNKEEALKFLQWVSEDAGQKILVEDAGFVSPFKSISYVANDPFAQTISDYTKAGKTSAWHWLGNKEGLAQNALGVVYQDFASGNLDVNGFVEAVEQVVKQYYEG